MDLLDKNWTLQVCHIYRKENERRDWLAIQDLIDGAIRVHLFSCSSFNRCLGHFVRGY
jgi:hypothetical protein